MWTSSMAVSKSQVRQQPNYLLAYLKTVSRLQYLTIDPHRGATQLCIKRRRSLPFQLYTPVNIRRNFPCAIRKTKSRSKGCLPATRIPLTSTHLLSRHIAMTMFLSLTGKELSQVTRRQRTSRPNLRLLKRPTFSSMTRHRCRIPISRT